MFLNPVLRYETHATSLDSEAGLASGHYDVELSPTGEQQVRATRRPPRESPHAWTTCARRGQAGGCFSSATVPRTRPWITCWAACRWPRRSPCRSSGNQDGRTPSDIRVHNTGVHNTGVHTQGFRTRAFKHCRAVNLRALNLRAVNPRAVNLRALRLRAPRLSVRSTPRSRPVRSRRESARSPVAVSAPSVETMIVVGNVPSPPGAPNFTSAPVSGSTVTLNWVAPTFGAPTSSIVEAGSTEPVAVSREPAGSSGKTPYHKTQDPRPKTSRPTTYFSSTPAGSTSPP